MRVVGFFLLTAAISVPVEMINVQQETEIVDLLSNDYFGSRVIIFLKLQSEGKELIKAASSVGLISSVMGLSEFQKIANLNFHPVPIVVVSLYEQHVSEFSQLTNVIKMSNMHWIVFSGMPWGKTQNFHVPYNCKFLLITSSNGDIDLKEIYRVARKTPLQFNELTTWNSDKLEKRDIPKTGFYSRRTNLMGIELNYLTHILDPCDETENAFASGNGILCIHEKVWQLIAEPLNITTKPVLFTERDFSLLTRALQQPQIEVSITGMLLSSQSVSFLGFFWPTFKSELEVFVRYGGKVTTWDRYLRPFTMSIWIAVIFWILGSSLVIFIAQKLASFYLKLKKGCHPEQFWTAIFAFLSQGTSEPAFSVWERLLLLSAFIGPAVLIPAYSASLTSFLAVQIPEMPFISLSGMKNRPEYKLTGTRKYNLKSFLQQGDDETSKYLSTQGMLATEKQPLTDWEGAQRMCKEPLALISATLVLIALKPPCKYYVLPKKFSVFHQSLTMTKKSQYEVPFNMIMRKLRFSGTLQRVKFSVTRKQIFASFLDKEISTNLPAVEFEDILVLLFFLVVAASTSFVILFVETIVFTVYYKKKKRPRVSRRVVLYPFYR